MAWSSLSSNQMVSYTDAQGGGFTLRPGESSVTSNQCMTKSQALAKYYLVDSNMASYSNNQLVPKSGWVVATYYTITSTTGSATNTGACSLPGTVGFVNTFYVQISTNRVFTNSELTSPLVGFNYWFVFDDLRVPQIDNNGYIIGYYYGCLF